MERTDKIKGTVYAVIAAATYGMIPLFALPLYSDGLNPDSVLFFRYLFAVGILAAMIRLRGRSFAISRREFLPLAAMGVVMSLSSITLFSSYQYMDGGIASTILFVYPIIVTIIMALFFKEKVTLTMVLCIILAFCGIVLLYQGDDGAVLSRLGTLLVLLSALFYAIYIVSVNRSVLRKIPTVKLTFYMLLFGITLFVYRIDFGQSLLLPTKWYLWGNLFALALFPTAISFICTTKAVQHIGATPTAILGALEPVTAVLIGITVFSEQMTVRIAVGLLMIVISVTLVVAGSSVNEKLLRFKKMFPKLRRRKK